MKNILIIAMAALGLSMTAASATVQCDRGAVFENCLGAANNERPLVQKATENGGGGSTGGQPGDTDNGKTKGSHKNNGYGNGDQDAPGNSGSHNNAENGPNGHANK